MAYMLFSNAGNALLRHVFQKNYNPLAKYQALPARALFFSFQKNYSPVAKCSTHQDVPAPTPTPLFINTHLWPLCSQLDDLTRLHGRELGAALPWHRGTHLGWDEDRLGGGGANIDAGQVGEAQGPAWGKGGKKVAGQCSSELF
eukprot:1150913-Pelagomonas_calceolata.AAC.8